mgnify:CR=1 FL=1
MSNGYFWPDLRYLKTPKGQTCLPLFPEILKTAPAVIKKRINYWPSGRGDFNWYKFWASWVCCVSRSQDFFTFIQIGSGHTVAWALYFSCMHWGLVGGCFYCRAVGTRGQRGDCLPYSHLGRSVYPIPGGQIMSTTLILPPYPMPPA